MASQKQIDANRKNAQESTGPRSPEGKAVVKNNAVKHGLYTADIILRSPHLSEDPRQYQNLLDSLIEELNPQGVIQQHLVIKIANIMWRYRRVVNAETSRINRQLETAAYDINRGDHLRFVTDPDDSDDTFVQRHQDNYVGVRSLPDASYRDSFMAYEMRLDRQLTRAFRLLYQLQLAQSSNSLQHPTTPPEIPENKPNSDP